MFWLGWVSVLKALSDSMSHWLTAVKKIDFLFFKAWTREREMGEGEANPEWDEIAENTGLDHEQVIMVVMMIRTTGFTMDRWWEHRLMNSSHFHQSTKPSLSNVATYIFTKYMRGQYAILLLQYHRWGIKVDIRYHNYIIQCGSILDIWECYGRKDGGQAYPGNARILRVFGYLHKWTRTYGGLGLNLKAVQFFFCLRGWCGK